MFVDTEFPKEAAHHIQQNGGIPLRAGVFQRAYHVAFVLVSDDPSGDNGAIERHLSLSASFAGRFRNPTELEVAKAIEFAGLKTSDQLEYVKTDKPILHIFRKSCESISPN